MEKQTIQAYLEKGTDIPKDVLDAFKEKYKDVNIQEVCVGEKCSIPKKELDALRKKYKVKTLKEIVDENCTISQDELNALKNKYGKVQILSVVIEEPERDEKGSVIDTGEVYYFAVRRPSQKLMRMLKSLANDDDKFISSAIKNLVVGGDMDALDDGLVYIGIASQLQGVLKPYQSFLTKA